MGVNFKSWLAVFVKLFLGTIYYQIGKMVQSTCGYPLDYDGLAVINYPKVDIGKKVKVQCPPGQTRFRKSIFLSTVVFSSMVLVLFYFVAFRRKTADPATYSRKMMLLMFIPSILECVALVLGFYAQGIMSLSLSMIMKGAKVVFSAMFTVTFLHRKQYAYHWFAVFFCLAGLAIAGTSEYLNKVTDAGYIVLGCCLCLAAECMKAFRVIYDEKMLKVNNCDTTFVVGMEGLYSMVFLVPTLLLVWLAIPGSDNDSVEHLPDTLYRISNSPMLIGLFSTLPIVVVFLAVAGMMIIKYLTGVHNALISVARSIAAWAFELVFYYAAPASLSAQYGEAWGTYSPLKLVGFLMVIIATLIYDGSLRLPCFFDYPKNAVTVTKDSVKRLDSETEVDGSANVNKVLVLKDNI